jgi:predicted transcriptional regulator
MTKSETLTIRLTPKLRADLEKIAALSQRSKSWHADQALALYLKHELPLVESIARAKARPLSEAIPYEEVFARVRGRVEARAKRAKRP